MYTIALYIILIVCVMIAFILAESKMRKEIKKKALMDLEQTKPIEEVDKKEEVDSRGEPQDREEQIKEQEEKNNEKI